MTSKHYLKIFVISLLFFLALFPFSRSEAGLASKEKGTSENLDKINTLQISFLENGSLLQQEVRDSGEDSRADILRDIISRLTDGTFPVRDVLEGVDRAQAVARVSFEGLQRAYFAGDSMTVNVSMEPVNEDGMADLYATVGAAGLPNVVYLTGDPGMPFSDLPTPVQSGIPIASQSYGVFQGIAPFLPFGVVLDLSAYLVGAGAEPTAENIISNIAEESISLIGVAQNELDRNQAIALRILRRLSSPDIFRAEVSHGVVRRLTLNLSIPKSILPQGYTVDDVALALLAESQNLLRIETPRKNLRLLYRSGGRVCTLTFGQYYLDIPVYGSWFQMTIEETANAFILRELSGKYTPDLSLGGLEPMFSAQQAKRLVAKKYGLITSSKLVTAVPVKLWIFDEALFTPECTNCPEVAHSPRLVWRVIFKSPRHGGSLADAFVDAVSGELLFHQPRTDAVDIRILTASDHTVETCGSEVWEDGIQAWFDEDGVCETRLSCDRRNPCGPWAGLICASPNTEGYDSFDHTWTIHRFYSEVFGQDSYHETQDRIMRMYIDVSYAPDPPNASSTDCGAFDVHKFSDGYAVLDVMAHEVGHSFHRSARRYDYVHQSGAVAEHVADMFGHFVGFWSALDPNWLIGEDTPGGSFRDMANPSRDHIDDYVPLPGDRANDYGGVHRYSTILSKAGYLMTDGGTHYDTGISVSGIGEEKARRIYHKTVVDKLSRNNSFEDFARKVHDACTELIGDYGITDNDCCQVLNAFASVGLGSADVDCDGISDEAEWDDDDDGYADATDNCELIPNPGQEDTDGDGLGDPCDPDADDDEVLNADDNCPYAANDEQQDRDGDGIGDACDDEDGDGIADSLDNCPDRRNRDQADRDGDGIGDLCDDDVDGDGIANSADNCPSLWNPDQTDRDDDGVGNLCDNCLEVYNPPMAGVQQDVDEDGLGDACDPDIDNDGVLNEDDNCPEEYTPNPELCVAPEGYACDEYGCPPRRLIPDSEYNAHFRWGHLAEADPSVVRSLEVFLNPCEVIDCERWALFGENDSLQVTVSMMLDLPSELAMEAPIIFDVAVLNEEGNLATTGEAYFVSSNNEMGLEEQRETQVGLSFQLLPSFTWRYSESVSTIPGQGQVPTNYPGVTLRQDTSNQDSYNVADDAAQPSYYLLITPRVVKEEHRNILSQTPLKLSFHVTHIQDQQDQ